MASVIDAGSSVGPFDVWSPYRGDQTLQTPTHPFEPFEIKRTKRTKRTKRLPPPGRVQAAVRLRTNEGIRTRVAEIAGGGGIVRRLRLAEVEAYGLLCLRPDDARMILRQSIGGER